MVLTFTFLSTACTDVVRSSSPSTLQNADSRQPATPRGQLGDVISGRCQSNDKVAIRPQDDAARIVDASGAGTVFLIEDGVHANNFSIRPKQGDAYCGEPGAVLDGRGKLASAFYGDAPGVLIDSITVRRYRTGAQRGAIDPSLTASGWIVRNVRAVDNYWAGLIAANNMRVLGGEYVDNGQLGIVGTSATGVVLDGLDDEYKTIDGPEIARNRGDHEGCGFEGGGMKWIGQVVVRNAHVHDNECRGLWSDGGASGAVIEYSLIEDNREEGILFETSSNAVVRHNEIHGNGLDGVGWYWAGGVTISSSSDVEVYRNSLSGNYNGIVGNQQHRPEAEPPANRLDNLLVHDNTICDTVGEHALGVAADNGADLERRNIVFSSNRTRTAPCR